MKNVLVSLCGKNLQIVTEAVYCLSVQKSFEIDEIVLISTQDLYCELKKEHEFDELCEKLEKLCCDYSIKKPFFEPQTSIVNLEYSLSTQTQESVYSYADGLMSIIRLLASNEDVRIFCSVAAGRKNMGIYLSYAMSFFGGHKDMMFHILASPEFESSKNYYPSKKSSTGDELMLIDIPFIKLNWAMRQQEHKTYKEYVEFAQEMMNNTCNPCVAIFFEQEKILQIDKVSIKFSPLEAAVYLIFFEDKDFLFGGCDFDIDRLIKKYCEVSCENGHQKRVLESIKNSHNPFIEIVIKNISSINSKIKKSFESDLISSYYIISSKGDYANKKYAINLPFSKRIKK